MICARCKKETNIHKMSFLNMEEICTECEERERQHPVYKFAKEVERNAVLNGDYNFPGVLNELNYKTEAEANLIARIKYGDTVKGIFDAWDRLVNNFSYNAADFASRLVENGIDYKDEAKSWIAYMAISGRVDGRNEASKEACKEIGIEFAEVTPLTMKMSRNHPTIQQQYTATMISIYTGKPTVLPYI